MGFKLLILTSGPEGEPNGAFYSEDWIEKLERLIPDIDITLCESTLKDSSISYVGHCNDIDEWISKIESLAENFVGTQKKQLIRYKQNIISFNSIFSMQ